MFTNHNKKLENITYSLERGIRFTSYGFEEFNFFMIQMKIHRKIIQSEELKINLTTEKANINKILYINEQENCIITPNSHEDPLVYDDEYFYICLQINSEMIKLFKNENFTITASNNGKVIYKDIGNNLLSLSKNYNQEFLSYISENEVTTREKSILTLHLGSSNGKYHEEEFIIMPNQSYNFRHLIAKYEYVGLQFSYTDNIPEIEEKYILVGQKGIYKSGKDKFDRASNPILFNHKYQRVLDDKELIEIDNVNDFLNFYQSKHIKPKVFTFSYEKLLQGYQLNNTYNQDGLFTKAKKNNKAHHYNLNVCKNCKMKSECLLALPSGLSNEMFKINLSIENETDCKIFKLLN